MYIEIGETKLSIVMGDITKQETEAIVNSANKSLQMGSGVCGAIHKAAGRELGEACAKVTRELLGGGNLQTGKAVITEGFNLPSKFVIHTVGPVWGVENGEELLSNCYKNCLQLAKENGVETISFPSISTGVYRFPIELACKIAIKIIVDYLKENSFEEIRIVLFSQSDYDLYEAELKKI